MIDQLADLEILVTTERTPLADPATRAAAARWVRLAMRSRPLPACFSAPGPHSSLLAAAVSDILYREGLCVPAMPTGTRVAVIAFALTPAFFDAVSSLLFRNLHVDAAYVVLAERDASSVSALLGLPVVALVHGKPLDCTVD